MFFSVIVPVYNVEEYLVKCIESVLKQTFSDFELILVDDGSPDLCPQICDDYAEKDSRIKVIHKPNGGLASARRAGIKVACGDYVFNLDSDDTIETDTLEYAYNAIKDSGCDIVSFAYRWVEDGKTVKITNDTVDEGLYLKEDIEKYIYPKLLMDKNMEHVSYYLSGKAVKRELITPHQLNVNEKISLGEDLCCVVPCYLNAQSVYISKKDAYLYTVRYSSLSKAFNSGQIYRIEDVINEISTPELRSTIDYEGQISRYSAFMCFAILASAADSGCRGAVEEIKYNIINSIHYRNIKKAEFGKITLKSRIGIFLMRRNCYKAAYSVFVFFNIIKKLLKRG